MSLQFIKYFLISLGLKLMGEFILDEIIQNSIPNCSELGLAARYFHRRRYDWREYQTHKARSNH
ncbi:hypothetical protein CA13_56610 [Planctomycetes bacterium CA13]|uniref:Uncharacterized protein n=1 Tax=Novipirellula herctigrandis TaxID=2527986 RepID=A0A5C5ZAI8_9BACT|nr:hypothetical protein CA13_56610 [Planctomycetes bacterium CA13]